MRNLRLLAVSAMLATGALAAAAIPAFATTTAPHTVGAATDAASTLPALSMTAPDTTTGPGPAVAFATYEGYDEICVSDGGTVYGVTANGINIRSQPDGSAIQGIQENRWWDVWWYVGSYSNLYTCTTAAQYGGQYWVPGYANYNGQAGWIGSSYLAYVEHWS
jgi:hypothetical protein